MQVCAGMVCESAKCQSDQRVYIEPYTGVVEVGTGTTVTLNDDVTNRSE